MVLTVDGEKGAQQGRVSSGLACEGTLRWTVCDVGPVIEEARRRLDLSPIATVACGRCAAAAAMLLRLSAKRPTRLDFELRGNGPLRKVLVEVSVSGDLRCLIGNPRVAEPAPEAGEHNLSIAAAIGKGVLKVRRAGESGPTYESQVELQNGEVGADLAHYLAQSEQRRSAVLLGVLLGPEGVRSAGGMIVEALPETDPHLITIVEDRIAQLDSVSRLLEQQGIDGALDALLGDLGPVTREERGLRYACRCRRGALLEQLQALPQQQLAGLVDAQGAIRAECAYCGDIYVYSIEEIFSAGSGPN